MKLLQLFGQVPVDGRYGWRGHPGRRWMGGLQVLRRYTGIVFLVERGVIHGKEDDKVDERYQPGDKEKYDIQEAQTDLAKVKAVYAQGAKEKGEKRRGSLI